jgi:hypothetical protein
VIKGSGIPIVRRWGDMKRWDRKGSAETCVALEAESAPSVGQSDPAELEENCGGAG